nr:hypothetical protein FVER53263_09880 [Fusarium verticillioides]
MVKIAIAGASSELAREILDRLVDTRKHDITALVRKDPSIFPELPGITWIKADYENKSELVDLFRGVETVLSFLAVHLDPGSQTQKRLIDAAVEAGVKRFAPSEWATGAKLADSLDIMSWYSGKIEIRDYLKTLNSDKKIIEYTLFQPGGFMDYLCHPYKTAKYITTTVVNVDIVKKRALVVEGTLDDEITYTSVNDIANIVAKAIDFEGEWPVIGGISGDSISIRQLLKIGEELRGEPFAIEWLKMEDLAAGELKTDNYPRLPLPSVPQDQVEAFSKMVVIAIYKKVRAMAAAWGSISLRSLEKDITAASIRKWKGRCDFSKSQAHKICSKPSPKFLPTRLIEIVRIDNDQKPCVRLVEGSSLNEDTEYTALSYCWGGDLKNCLKEGNKDSYRTEVPWKHIPRTIQDAILTSHKLGIGFIWVDSLCIIQDSKTADKDLEISQMTEVYTHAALTIAARRAPDADAGFLHPRSVPSGTTIVEFRDDNGETRRGTLTFEAAERYEDQNILDTRGWTLQEYVLSRRLLIIGSWTTTWSCRKERKGNCDGWSLDRDLGDPFQNDATWASGGSTEFTGAHRLDAIAFFGTHPDYDQPRPEDQLIKWEWYELVELYTRRNLTKRTDRILAISGLAQIFSPMRGGEYAAGLWVKDMPETLLWENSSAALNPRPSDQGPSWSWTAINGIAEFSKSHDQNVLSVECIECELGQPGAPFGYVKRGALRATGPALDLEWKCCTSPSSCKYFKGHHLRYLTPDRGYVNAPIIFRPDAREPDWDWTTVTLLAVKADECIDSTEGLVLRKKDDTNYSRLGYYSGSSHPHIDCPLPMVKKWGLRTFTIV